MPPSESDPRTASWPAAVVRALHPVRLFLCAAGLAVSLLMCEAVLAILGEVPWGLEAWWQRPLEGLQHLAEAVFTRGLGTALFRGLVLAAPLSAVWGLVAGWIARAELLRQCPAEEPGQVAANVQAGPTWFVVGKAKALVRLLPPVLFLCGMLLLPGVAAGLFTLIPVLGPLFVAVLLPLVILSSFVVVLVLAGSVSFVLMPAAVAAEGTDHFDALARGYSYLFQRPLHFAGWCGLALAVAALPAVGAFWLLGNAAKPLGPVESILTAAAVVLGLSLFWTLQALVYLKLRRALDGVGEDQVWDGPAGEKAGGKLEGKELLRRRLAGWDGPAGEKAGGKGPRSSAAEAGAKVAEQAEAEKETLRSVKPQRTEITFQDTHSAAQPASLHQLVAALAGLLWVATVLGAGAFAVRDLAAPPLQEFSPAGVRQAVLDLAGQRPALLVGLAAAAVLLGGLGFLRPAKMVARMAAVRMVFQRQLPLRAAWSFAGRTGWQGFGSALLAAAGAQLYLGALVLLPPALQGVAGWQEAVLFGGLGLVLLEAGALGLGAAAVEGGRTGETRTGAVGCFVGNGGETLASAATGLLVVPVRFLAVATLVGLTWFLTCESLSWIGGDSARWIRWGLDGTLLPQPDAGPDQLAAALAGVWFFAAWGLVLAYPIAYVLGWGPACYLRARQQALAVPPGEMELTEEETQALLAEPKTWDNPVAPLVKNAAANRSNGTAPQPSAPPPPDPL